MRLSRSLSIYVIAPAWLVKSRPEHSGAVKNLQKLGFRVINPGFRSRPLDADGKAAEIEKAFRDPRADIILALRGGYGSMKILPRLDFAELKKRPKILAGFSDLSALLNPIFEKTGIVGLHSPMLWNFSNPRPAAVRSFLNALGGFPQKNLLAGARVETLSPGRAQGVLKGGNLVTLSALIGTPWETDTRGAVVFLEDVDEKIHEIDRCLTQWALAGKFNGVRGLVLGDFRGANTRDVFAIIRSLAKISFPVIYCPAVGHVPGKITFPVGARVKLEAKAGAKDANLTITSLAGYPLVKNDVLFRRGFFYNQL